MHLKAMKPMAATPTTQPMTMPAIAPPLRPAASFVFEAALALRAKVTEFLS